ncbi:MAG: GNAT family N-acetyltransferase [Boseongicola sp.]|nr:GNAT family N-acetyltransferase [Boseongicola sp.]
MSDVQIRPATTSDEDAIWSMLEPVFRAGDTYAIDPDITRADALRYWFAAQTYITDGGTYYIRPNQMGGGDHVCNAGFVTAAQASGRGVARAMLAHALSEAKTLGFDAMQFNFVLASNTRAIDIWQRAGFNQIGRIPQAFRHPRDGKVDALILHKFLD